MKNPKVKNKLSKFVTYNDYYGLTFSPKKLDARAKLLLSKVRKYTSVNKNVVPIFLASGISGASALNSIVRIFPSKMSYGAFIVKKSGEKTHRATVTQFVNNIKRHHTNFFYIFIDDVISSGQTLKNCTRVINNKNNLNFFKSTLNIENITIHDKFYFMFDKWDDNNDEFYEFRKIK